MIYLCLVLLFILILVLIINYMEHASIREQLRQITSDTKTNRLITSNFQFLGLNDLINDINHLVKKERASREELENEKQKIKSQITSISHDFRTPLTSVMGYIELLKTTEDKKAQDEYLNIIQKKAKGLEKLVSQFYEISLLEDENYEIPLEMVYVSAIIEDIGMEYYEDLKLKGINLELEITDSRQVIGNNDEYMRCFNNLLSNICKYSKSKVEIFHGEIDGVLTTQFKNDIKESDEKLENNKLFEKFYTGEKSRSSASTGVGMYTTKLLINKMGHSISANVVDGVMIVEINYKIS